MGMIKNITDKVQSPPPFSRGDRKYLVITLDYKFQIMPKVFTDMS